MSTELTLRLADNNQRLAAYRNVHEFWGRGRSLEEHMRQRQESVQHQRADWYVGCLDGEVVVSLGSYPMAFCYEGDVVAGIAIGAVHTLPSYRRRGYARALLEWVEAEASTQGARLSMLYSDIDPAYYARVGYVGCASNQGRSNGRVPPPTSCRLVAFDPAAQLSDLKEFYRTYHQTQPVSIVRDDEYWYYLLRKNSNDRFLWLQRDGERLGYVRVGLDGPELRLADYALHPLDDELLVDFYGEFIRYAGESGYVHAGGWLPDCPATRQLFDVQPRSAEITMIKQLDLPGSLGENVRKATDKFCEIDHV